MNLPVILAYPLAILANFALALVVFFRNSKNIANRFFALFTLAMVGWLTTLFFSTFVTSFELVNLLTKLHFAFVLLLVYALFYFAYYFPSQTFNLKPLFHLIFAIETFGMIILTLLSFQLASGEVSKEIGLLTIYGQFYPLFVVHFLFYSGAALLILFSKLKKFKGLARAQIQCFLFALSIALVFEITLHLLLPLVFKIQNLYALRPLTTLVFLGVTAYGMVRFRLLNIRLIIARTIAYFLLTFLVVLLVTAALYAFSVFVIGQFIGGTQMFVFTLLVLFILFAFPTLNSFFTKTTSELILKDHYDSPELLRKLSLTIVSSRSLEELLKNVLRILFKKMRVSCAWVGMTTRIELTKMNSNFSNQLFFLKKREVKKFLEVLGQRKRILISEELKEEKIQEVLGKFKIEVLIPLLIREETIGFLLLGEKSTGENYSSQDITVLEILAPELALAIQNVLAFGEISRFNITLKEEIEKATKELRQANEKLQELDKLKDEFLSTATHALRTPMTGIKGYLDMVLAGDAGKINERVKEFLAEALEMTNQLIRLINDMLNVSRLEQQKLALNIKEINLGLEIKKVIGQLSWLAKEKGLKISYQPFKNLPLVKADSVKVNQVLNDLIGNAIQFTERGGIIIDNELKNGLVTTHIEDTGIGINEEDISKLFQKFSKIDNSLRGKRGTGLGLYISKNLIEAMGGRIWVKSALGKGSTFSFSLPKA